MEMQFKNEIKKLSDIVVWADNLITAAGFDVEKYKNDAASAYCHVKAYELWKIKTVTLEAMERHTVYTNALNKDIADKAAKIDLLEKEIEGRKEGYAALKTQMDTKYISIEEHNNICKTYEDKVAKLEKESEKWRDLAKMNKDTISDQYSVCEEFKEKIAELEKELADCKVKIRHQKENLDGINKTLEIRNKEIDTLVKTLQTTRREIEGHESENARLSEKIDELKKQNEYLTKELDDSYKAWEKDSKNYQKRDMTLVDELSKKNDEIKKLKEENSYLKKESKNKNDIIRKAYVRYVDEACKGREEIMNECYEKLTKDDTGYTGFKQYTLRALEAQEGNEKKTKEFLCDAAEIIFYNKRAEEKRKEETKKELNEAFGVPCGEDAIE